MKTVENDLKLDNNIYKAQNTHTTKHATNQTSILNGSDHGLCDGWFYILGF